MAERPSTNAVFNVKYDGTFFLPCKDSFLHQCKLLSFNVCRNLLSLAIKPLVRLLHKSQLHRYFDRPLPATGQDSRVTCVLLASYQRYFLFWSLSRITQRTSVLFVTQRSKSQLQKIFLSLFSFALSDICRNPIFILRTKHTADIRNTHSSTPGRRPCYRLQARDRG